MTWILAIADIDKNSMSPNAQYFVSLFILILFLVLVHL